jgi:hypothetical protein
MAKHPSVFEILSDEVKASNKFWAKVPDSQKGPHNPAWSKDFAKLQSIYALGRKALDRVEYVRLIRGQ